MVVDNLCKDKIIYSTSEKNFGITFSVLFLLLAVYPLFKGQQIKVWPLIISMIFFTTSFVFPKCLKPLNYFWGKFSLVISKLMTPITFGAIYVIVIIPISIYMRFIGKDSLKLSSNALQETYWVARQDNNHFIKNFNNQF